MALGTMGDVESVGVALLADAMALDSDWRVGQGVLGRGI
jgi:hypothetical protein